jgi:hypothetical protein
MGARHEPWQAYPGAARKGQPRPGNGTPCVSASAVLSEARGLILVRALAAFIAAMDFVLGIGAAAEPELYLRIAHQGITWAPGLVARSGVWWTFFAALAALVAIAPRRYPPALFLLGALHIIEAPSDLAYLLRSPDLRRGAELALAVFPLLDVIAGVIFFRAFHSMTRGPSAQQWHDRNTGPQPG